MLQIILGSVEAPGGFRFKPPYPKPATDRTPGRIAKSPPARRSTARIWASSTGPMTYACATTAALPASTKHSLGKTRCRPMA